jgi:hypothetical protein
MPTTVNSGNMDKIYDGVLIIFQSVALSFDLDRSVWNQSQLGKVATSSLIHIFAIRGFECA